MSIIICPGLHDSVITQSFLEGLRTLLSNRLNFTHPENLLVFPTQDYPALSALHIVQFLRDHLGSPQTTSPLVFISFSAGVVGSIGAAWGWQLLGGHVKAFIALDGWGVPLFGNFSIHRLSHDFYTHWSSAVLGSGEDSFYADPAVEHLELWRSPQIVQGWWLRPAVGKSQPCSRLTAAQFLTMLIERYGERA
jgi:hypothetical protein